MVTVDNIDVSACKYFLEYYCGNEKCKYKACKCNKDCSFKRKAKKCVNINRTAFVNHQFL